jgi:predicted Ser/Thr protein kinase
VACLRENTVSALVDARLSLESMLELEAHAVACVACNELLVAAMGASTNTAPTLGIRGRRAVPYHDVTSLGALEPGTLVERFTVLGLVGRGGMGEVYAAYDPTLDRRVALKMMHGGAGSHEPHGQACMLREARAIAQLSHPNVVVVYEVGTFRGRVFLAMEFVEGRTLAEWFAEKERSWREIVGVFLEAARGLSAAHRAGFVHRDFKPQNVMVSDDGRVRVMDFGLARRVDDLVAEDSSTLRDPRIAPTSEDELTETREQLGTPLYMAPEQFAAARVDARTDQFSFCVALYWALYGVHPFGAGQSTRKMPRRSTNPPAWLSAVVRRGLRVAPESRWPTMDQLAAAMSCEPPRRSGAALAVAVVVVAVAAVLVGLRGFERQRVVHEAGASRMPAVPLLTESAAPTGLGREGGGVAERRRRLALGETLVASSQFVELHGVLRTADRRAPLAARRARRRHQEARMTTAAGHISGPVLRTDFPW